MFSSKKLNAIMFTGLLLRAIPLIVWTRWPCVRDECTYLKLADRMVEGEGMTSSVGWLWAPGYPSLIALHQLIFGHGSFIKGTQVVISVAVTYLMYLLGKRFASISWASLENDSDENTKAHQESVERAGLLSAALYALSPTQIFFAQSLWSEVLYGGLLLLTIFIFVTAIQHRQHLKYAAWIGVLVGFCVLFRGVATYMLPIFFCAFLWKSYRNSLAWKQSGIVVLLCVSTVAPYSLYVSQKFDHFIVSDRTLGQMMWLGNNDFKPIAFDWGNGPLSGRAFKRHTKEGRKPCGSKKQPMERETCQTEAGKKWILDNSKEFVSRMPLRVAQLLNPHSFLTRHLRMGFWRGIPQWVDETIVLWNLFWNLLVLLGGSAFLALRGRGAGAILISGILLYHVAAISVLAGLTRYRVPLEPLLMIFLAGGLSLSKADWGREIRKIGQDRWRFGMTIVLLLVIYPLVFWFFPAGWPWWRSWSFL